MLKALVVDDDAGVRAYTAEILQGDFDVTEASNGEEALNLMGEDDYDVILLDINMPVTNGWEALQIIRDPYDGWPNTKVIMLTCDCEIELVLKAWNLGVSDFLAKPYEAADLLKVVHKAVSALQA